jgi:hypothetical protein
MVDDSGRALVDREAVTHLENARESGPPCRGNVRPEGRVNTSVAPFIWTRRSELAALRALHRRLLRPAEAVSMRDLKGGRRCPACAIHPSDAGVGARDLKI